MTIVGQELRSRQGPGLLATECPAMSLPTRAQLRPGQKVAIILKADQASGRRTVGLIAQLLTKSPTHPHGIKVRLQDGQVGRVQEILT